MLAGYDDNGPQLYQIDPSGTFFAWKASAIGKNMANAKTFLEKRYADDVEVEDAVHTALLTLKESFEGEMTGDNIEARSLAFVSGWHCCFWARILTKRT
jgi:20S proteasome subunit alpha 2